MATYSLFYFEHHARQAGAAIDGRLGTAHVWVGSQEIPRALLALALPSTAWANLALTTDSEVVSQLCDLGH